MQTRPMEKRWRRRSAGCWAPSQDKLAIEQTSGRQRINIQGAIDLETGQTRMIEALTIDAASTIRLLQSIEIALSDTGARPCFPGQRALSSRQARAEMASPVGTTDQTEIHLALLLALEPDRAVRGGMHRHVTHNKCYTTCGQFADATLNFLRGKVPKNWNCFRDSVTDNFRVINPKDFRIVM